MEEILINNKGKVIYMELLAVYDDNGKNPEKVVERGIDDSAF